MCLVVTARVLCLLSDGYDDANDADEDYYDANYGDDDDDDDDDDADADHDHDHGDLDHVPFDCYVRLKYINIPSNLLFLLVFNIPSVKERPLAQ